MKHSSGFARGSRGDRHDFITANIRDSQSIPVWNLKVALHVANKIQRLPRFQPVMQTSNGVG